MTRCVLPGMVERKRGLVICIGSGVGSLLPSSPLLAAYAGSKVRSGMNITQINETIANLQQPVLPKPGAGEFYTLTCACAM